MRKQTRSILDEITGLVPKQDKHFLVESLAVQAIDANYQPNGSNSPKLSTAPS